MHQAFFSAPIQTIIDAAHNGQLEGVPFLSKPALIHRYLAPSPATPKGRMKRTKKGIRSTRPKTKKRKMAAAEQQPEAQEVDCRVVPPEGQQAANNVFCFAALADKQIGTMYTDATGALPVLSLDGMQYFFVAYDYDTNYIFAIPIPNLKDETIIEAFENVFNELSEKGHRPTFNVSDNQAAKPIKQFLQKENCKWQFVDPMNHRVNAAERAIQTYKNHFISGLRSIDDNWPLQLWDQMAEQAIITLNLLRTLRIDPKKSAYHQLNRQKYNWNALPLARPRFPSLALSLWLVDPEGPTITSSITLSSPVTVVSWLTVNARLMVTDDAPSWMMSGSPAMPISSAVKRTVSTSTYPLLLVIFSPPPVTDDVCVSRALAMVMSMTLSRVTLAATSTMSGFNLSTPSIIDSMHSGAIDLS